ncbi:methyltransferase dimerization domain-containing protein [Leifsonia sp. NPDC080035]|uniref:Methyltransferase dimerization domain-containing protein n=1 Tax=Leifsonia sp. NPDC080035 TaxID=3143936 RepID=A0AAU7G8U4_9MICO
MTTTRTPAATTPEAIVDIAIGFMGAKQLFAASRVGLFSALADGPLDAAAVSAATGVPERQARILADSMAAQGLLTRTDGRYELTADAAAYLTGDRAELDLGPFLAFLGATSYTQWLGYDKTVDSDEPGTLELDEAGWGDFLAGVMRYNELHAAMLARHFDFTPYRDALDLGGLSPAFAVEGMTANPELNVRFVFDPQSVEPVRQAVAEAGFADRTSVEGAETATAEPGGSHDLVLVNHVIHRFDEAQNRAIFRNARDAAADGATLLVLDFFLDDDPQQRKIDALHAGEYYNIDGTVVYPESFVREWLADAGWRAEGTVALPGSPRILVARAV